MSLAIALGALTVVVLALLLAPLLRSRRRAPAAAAGRAPFDLTVYRDQLAEVERDRERGLIDAEQARAARLEIERRMLGAVRREEADEARPLRAGGGRVRVATAAALALALPGLSALLYLQLGSPQLPDRPLAARQDEEPPAMADLPALAERLEQRLAERPEELTGWVTLARVYMALDRGGDAVRAFRRALELRPDDPGRLAGRGAALVHAAGGVVTPEAERHFEAALTERPDEPVARYYLGLAAAQAGELETAFETWHGLLADAPADAPWRPQVVAALRAVAADLGRDPGPLAEAPPAAAAPPAGAGGGPPAADAARLAAMSPEQQAEAIRGMVDGLAARLEENPDDVEGWLRLGRARAVLGEPELAKQAFERALRLRPDAPPVLKAYAAALLGPVEPASGAPTVGEEAAELYRRAAELAPNDPEAHWYLGLAALQAGDREGAAEHWRRVLAQLEPGDPNYAVIRQRLEAIEGKG